MKTTKLTLRLPVGLHRRIVTLGDASFRSLNSEIVYLLNVALDHLDAENGGTKIVPQEEKHDG